MATSTISMVLTNAQSLRWPGNCRIALHWQATKLSMDSTISALTLLRPTSTKRSSKNDLALASSLHQILHHPLRDTIFSPAHLAPHRILLRFFLMGFMVQDGVRGIENDASIHRPFHNLPFILALARELGLIQKHSLSLSHLEHLGRQVTTYPNHPLSTATNMAITKILTSLPFTLSRKYPQPLTHRSAMFRMETVLAFPSTVSIYTLHLNPHLLVPHRPLDPDRCATGKPMSLVKKVQQTCLCTLQLLRLPPTPVPNPDFLNRQPLLRTPIITMSSHHL